MEKSGFVSRVRENGRRAGLRVGLMIFCCLKSRILFNSQNIRARRALNITSSEPVFSLPRSQNENDLKWSQFIFQAQFPFY